MKKTKMIPILCGVASLTAIVPIVTSCSGLITDGNAYALALKIFKGQAIKDIVNSANDAAARQPEISKKILFGEIPTINCVNSCTFYAQAWATISLKHAFDSMARQPEIADKILELLLFCCQAVLTQPNENAFAITSSGVFEAIARQPEAADKFILEHVKLVNDIVNNSK